MFGVCVGQIRFPDFVGCEPFITAAAFQPPPDETTVPGSSGINGE
jgi:hypothetical protein